MVHGRSDEDPLTDILVNRRRVFSPTIDALIQEIARLGGRDVLEREFYWLAPLPPTFEDDLRQLLERLRSEAQVRRNSAA